MAYQVVPRKRPDGCHITRATRTVWPSISATGSSLKGIKYTQGLNTSAATHSPFSVFAAVQMHSLCRCTQASPCVCYTVQHRGWQHPAQGSVLPCNCTFNGLQSWENNNVSYFLRFCDHRAKWSLSQFIVSINSLPRIREMFFRAMSRIDSLH